VALEKLATAADVTQLPARALTRLARRLVGASSVALLRRARWQYPADFWVNHDLGWRLYHTPEWDESVWFLTVAAALRPDTPECLVKLGSALKIKRQLDEASACFRKAIELNPKSPAHLTHVGTELMVALQLDEAIACYRKAIELDPKFAGAHFGLGNALGIKGLQDEAMACFRKAIELDPKLDNSRFTLDNFMLSLDQQLAEDSARSRDKLDNAPRDKGQADESIIASFRFAIGLDPKNAPAHFGLGNALFGKGQVEEAIASYSKAIELDPKLAWAHNSLGDALSDKGQVEEAIASYSKAIELDPKLAWAHNSLGVALSDKGQVDEAIARFRKAIELDPMSGSARTALANAERMATARDKLPAFQDGSYTPASNGERLGLAGWCRIRKLHRTATRLYAEAFAADPMLADDVAAGHRCDATSSAALAAAGKGDEAAVLDDPERARLRKQALDWLRADLARWTELLEPGPPALRAAARKALKHWQHDRDLVGIRDPKALAQLPEAERKECEALWAEVQALIDRAQKTAA
jgi:superkiller protein 3